MKKRGLVIGLLIMLALVTSGFTYAFWAGTVTQAAANVPGTVTIGEGGTSTVTFTFDAASAADLVPATVNPANSTAVLTFDVAWDEDVANTADLDGDLTVVLGTVTIGSLTPAQISAMFTITITAGQGAAISMNGATVEVQITVEFTNEPASQAIYDEVANGTLSIPVTVTVGNFS